MKPNKRKSRKTSRRIQCPCGNTFTAGFRSGVVKHKLNCPRCRKPISTAKTVKLKIEDGCPGCGRAGGVGKHGCKFCGWTLRRDEP